MESSQDKVTSSFIRKALISAGLSSDTFPGMEEHLLETPSRVAKFWTEFIHPDINLPGILKSGFGDSSPHSETGAMVVQQDIPFRGLCAHHLLPFVGMAAIGYLPRRRVVGLSKLARLVDAAGTMMPSTQEAITNLIADTIDKTLDCSGVIVLTSANHMCMAARGVATPHTVTKVSAIRGLFIHGPSARNEFFQILGGR